jgi:hypothetical protein
MNKNNYLYHEQLDGYLNTEKYLQFLKNLSKKLKGQRVALYHDGLSVH